MEDLANVGHFPLIWNSYEAWDPKLGFNNYCIVYEKGEYYQWNIAKFVSIEGSHRGWWKSDIVDLTDLKKSRI